MAPTVAKVLRLAVLLAVAGSARALVAAQRPLLELDHVYIVVPPRATAAVQALRGAGIVIDTEAVRHDGEGTTSLAAFFENAYLELMWVDSSVAVDSAHEFDVADFRRATAWGQTGASPFGIGLHFLTGTPSDLGIPFRLDAVPDSRPTTYYVLLRQPAESLAPDLFIMPTDRAVTTWLARFRDREPERFAHPAGVHRISRIVVRTTPRQRPGLAALDLRLVRFDDSSAPLLEVEFDNGTRGKRWDLRPALPLILSY